MLSRTAISLPTCIRRFPQWRMAVLVFVLLCNVAVAPEFAFAQRSNAIRIEIRSDMTLSQIRAELSRYIAPEIEGEIYRYRVEAVRVEPIGMIVILTLSSTPLEIVFSAPVAFSSRTQPATRECGVSVAPYNDGEYVGLLWQISCGTEYYKIFHPLP